MDDVHALDVPAGMTIIHSETDTALKRLFFVIGMDDMAALNPEEQFTVIVTEEGVACEHPRRKREFIRWDDINEISIVTTDEGPLLPDLWLLLTGSNNGCSIPQGAAGYDELFDRICQFPDFDFESVIEASACASNARFTCWKRPNLRERKMASPSIRS